MARTPRIEIRGGDKQSGAAGTGLTEPLTVRVLVDGDALPGVEVEFRVLAGEAAVKAAKALTDADGVASTVVTLGQAEGAISVGAFVAGFPSATFSG